MQPDDRFRSVVMGRLGIPLVDGADPERLAALCAEQGRRAFLFVAAVPRILGPPAYR